VKKLLIIFLVIVAFTIGFSKLKVGFVYVGPVGDAGWTYAHDQGRLYLE